jgi:hypothetical protein
LENSAFPHIMLQFRNTSISYFIKIVKYKARGGYQNYFPMFLTIYFFILAVMYDPPRALNMPED